MATSSLVDDDEFREAMRPLTSSLLAYAASIRDQPDEHGHLPSHDSQGMAELASEKRWSVPEWLEPVRSAHSYGGMVTYLIAEHLSAYAAIVDRSVVGPAYGHMPTVRAVIEAVPIAHWLLDPSIGTESRIQRSITYRMHSAHQQKRMVKVPGAVESAERSIAACRNYSTSQIWTVAGNAVQGQALPKPTTYSTVALGGEARELDQAIWAMACATHHANWFALADGLRDRMIRNDALDPLGGIVPITVEARQLAMFAVVLFYGADAVVRARTSLMGWGVSSEMSQSREALLQTSRLVVNQLQGQTDTDHL